MDYESEIDDLKDRLAKLEQRLEGIKAEVKTLLTKWNGTALVYDNFDSISLHLRSGNYLINLAKLGN